MKRLPTYDQWALILTPPGRDPVIADDGEYLCIGCTAKEAKGFLATRRACYSRAELRKMGAFRIAHLRTREIPT